jgi:hypothetical protein
MPENERAIRFVDEYLAYAASVRDGVLDNSKQWVFDEFNRLVREEPEEAWRLIQDAVHRSGNDQILAFVAAGPLEDLIRLHARAFMERIETAAANDRHFRRAVSGVWVSDLPEDLQRRLERLIGEEPRL